MPYFKKALLLGMFPIVACTTATVLASEFGYLGEIGPDFWGDLDPAWETCGSGTEQSPVNLGRQRNYPHLDIEYDSATTGEIFNNGHTIEVEVDGDNTLILDGTEYELAQFHFHTASEHRVAGRGYDMEMHLVHSSAEGENAVIGVFLKRDDSSGPLSLVFDAMIDNLEPGVEDAELKFDVGSPFDVADFLPDSEHHIRYQGSLTTPPCTEGVKWVIMKHPVTVSDEDMAQFAERISFNARFTQRRVP